MMDFGVPPRLVSRYLMWLLLVIGIIGLSFLSGSAEAYRRGRPPPPPLPPQVRRGGSAYPIMDQGGPPPPPLNQQPMPPQHQQQQQQQQQLQMSPHQQHQQQQSMHMPGPGPVPPHNQQGLGGGQGSFSHRRIHYGPPPPKFRGKHPFRRPPPPPPPGHHPHHHRGPPHHMHPPPTHASRPPPGPGNSNSQMVIPLPPSQGPSMMEGPPQKQMNMPPSHVNIGQTQQQHHQQLQSLLPPPRPSASVTFEQQQASQHIFSARPPPPQHHHHHNNQNHGPPPPQHQGSFSNDKPIMEYVPPFSKNPFLPSPQTTIIQANIDPKNSREENKPQIIQLHLPPQKPGDSQGQGSANVIQIHITSTPRPSENGKEVGKEYFTGSTFRPPFDVIKNEFSKPMYGPPPEYPNTDYRPNDQRRGPPPPPPQNNGPQNNGPQNNDEDRSDSRQQDHFIVDGDGVPHEVRPNYETPPFNFNRNSNEVHEPHNGGKPFDLHEREHGKTAYGGGPPSIEQDPFPRRPLHEGTHYNKGSHFPVRPHPPPPSPHHDHPHPGYGAQLLKDESDFHHHNNGPPRDDFPVSSEPEYRPSEQDFEPPHHERERERERERDQERERERERDEFRPRDPEDFRDDRDRQREPEGEYSRNQPDHGRRPDFDEHERAEFSRPKPAYGGGGGPLKDLNKKYSQPDPLYHPEGDVTKSSDEINYQNPPDRYDNSFSSGYNKKGDKFKQAELEHNARLPSSSSSKHPSPEEVMAALGLSGNEPTGGQRGSHYDGKDKIVNPGHFEPLNLMEYIRSKVEENERGASQKQSQNQKEPLYSRQDSAAPVYQPPNSDEQGYPGTSYKIPERRTDGPKYPPVHSHYSGSASSKVKIFGAIPPPTQGPSSQPPLHYGPPKTGHDFNPAPLDPVASNEYSTLNDPYRHPPPYLADRTDHVGGYNGPPQGQHGVQVHGGNSYSGQASNNYGHAVTPAYGEAYPVYVTEPEPIIEIIVQDSNVTLPAIPKAPTPPPPPPTPEPVHVFYVRYSANNKSQPEIILPGGGLGVLGGYASRGPAYAPAGSIHDPQINLETPIASIPIRQPDSVHAGSIPSHSVIPFHQHQQQPQQHHHQPPPSPPSPPINHHHHQQHHHPQQQQQPQQNFGTTEAPGPNPTTTMRAVIRPDKNEFSSSRLGVTFDHPPNHELILQQHLQNHQQHQQNIQNEQQQHYQQQQQQQQQFATQPAPPQPSPTQPQIQQQQQQLGQYSEPIAQQVPHPTVQDFNNVLSQTNFNQQQQQQQGSQRGDMIMQPGQQHQQGYQPQPPPQVPQQQQQPQNFQQQPQASSIVPQFAGQQQQQQFIPPQQPQPQQYPEPINQEASQNQYNYIPQQQQQQLQQQQQNFHPIGPSNQPPTYQQQQQPQQFVPQQQNFAASQQQPQFLQPQPHPLQHRLVQEQPPQQQNFQAPQQQQQQQQPQIQAQNQFPANFFRSEPDIGIDPMWSDWNQNQNQQLNQRSNQESVQAMSTEQGQNQGGQNQNQGQEYQGSFSQPQEAILPPPLHHPSSQSHYGDAPPQQNYPQQRNDFQPTNNNNNGQQQFQGPMEEPQENMQPPVFQDAPIPFSNLRNEQLKFDPNPIPFYPEQIRSDNPPPVPMGHVTRKPNYDNIGMKPPMGPVYPGFSKRMGLDELTTFLENNNNPGSTHPQQQQQQQQGNPESDQSHHHQQQNQEQQQYEFQQQQQQNAYQGSQQQLINTQFQQQIQQHSGEGSSPVGRVQGAPAKLPDDVPEDLKQQLMSSGILGNADIQVINFDENLFKELGDLPPEALAALGQQSGSLGLSASNLEGASNGGQQQQQEQMMPSPSNLWQGGSAAISGGAGATDLASILGSRTIREVLVVRNNRPRPKRGGAKRSVILLVTDKDDVLLYHLKKKTLTRVGDVHKPILSRAMELSHHKFNISTVN